MGELSTMIMKLYGFNMWLEPANARRYLVESSEYRRWLNSVRDRSLQRMRTAR